MIFLFMLKVVIAAGLIGVGFAIVLAIVLAPMVMVAQNGNPDSLTNRLAFGLLAILGGALLIFVAACCAMFLAEAAKLSLATDPTRWKFVWWFVASSGTLGPVRILAEEANKSPLRYGTFLRLLAPATPLLYALIAFFGINAPSVITTVARWLAC
jgi:hypothetical protein